MSKSDAYYQFPLCSLAYGGDPKARLYHVISWCAVHVGKELATNMTTAELLESAQQIPHAHLPGGLRNKDRAGLVYTLGMKTLGLINGTVEGGYTQAATLENFINRAEAAHGRYPLVRVRHDLMWDALRGSMPYRDFSVLCSVYSIIGAKESPVRIIRDRIIAGALGYKTAALMTPGAIAARPDHATPLTTMQVRTTLNHLEATTLFQRVQLSPRRVYFSHRMTREAMTAYLLKWKTRQPIKLSNNRKSDRELQARIRDSIKVVIPAAGASRSNHRVTMTQP